MKAFQEESTLQIKQMSGTIDDFRDFFQPRQAKETFLLNDVIEHLILIMSPIFKASNIELIFHEKEDTYALGYPNELAQAILNLLNNSKDSLLEHTTKNRKIEIILQEEKDEHTLIIIDNAGGIPEKILEKIFDPYFSTKSKQEGTGLGLYMSKMIIEKHMKGLLTLNNYKDGAIAVIKIPKI